MHKMRSCFPGLPERSKPEANIEAGQWHGGDVVHTGLSYGAVEIVLSSLGMGIGKTSVFRAVQAIAKQVPGMRSEKLLSG